MSYVSLKILLIQGLLNLQLQSLLVWGGDEARQVGDKKAKPIPASLLGVGTKYCPIPTPPPLQGGKNQCEGGGGEGKIAIPKFLEATWYISLCILVHSTFHSLHQNGKQAYYITKQFLEGVPMRYTKQGFLRKKEKEKDTSSKNYKVSIIFYF